MSLILHQEKLNNNITIRVERSGDPDYPGLYVYAMLKKDDEEEEIGCVLIELEAGILKARVWDHKNCGNDPITTELYGGCYVKDYTEHIL